MENGVAQLTQNGAKGQLDGIALLHESAAVYCRQVHEQVVFYRL